MDPRRRYERLQAEWDRLAQRYLPVVTAGSPWRASAAVGNALPEQGWKLHLSATILSAGRLLRRVGPALAREGVLFKGPRNISDLQRLNAGLDWYSQIGKCLTVYCADDRQATRLAATLDELSRGIAHPLVPYDHSYRPGSCVYYRYGAFGGEVLIDDANGLVTALTTPDGRHIPDRRDAVAVPPWIEDPFCPGAPIAAAPPPVSPLASQYRAFQVIRRRGKGGVYLALDVTRQPPRLCVLKEGLRHGETDFLGRDGYARVKNEVRALAALRRLGIPVPATLASFDVEGNRYVALEHLDGQNLAQALANKQVQGAGAALAITSKLVEEVRRIHAGGWAWRDCKPENIVVGPGWRLHLVDFEGACRTDSGYSEPWGTDGYRAPGDAPRQAVDDDEHALAATIDEVWSAATGGLRRPPRLDRLLHRAPSSATHG